MSVSEIRRDLGTCGVSEIPHRACTRSDWKAVCARYLKPGHPEFAHLRCNQPPGHPGLCLYYGRAK